MGRRILSDIEMMEVVRNVTNRKYLWEQEQPKVQNRTIQDLQNLLNTKGYKLNPDNKAGNMTLGAINQALSKAPVQNTQTTTKVTGSPTDIEGGVNVSTINIPSKVATGITIAPTTSGYNVPTKDVSTGQAGTPTAGTPTAGTPTAGEKNVEPLVDYTTIDFGS